MASPRHSHQVICCTPCLPLHPELYKVLQQTTAPILGEETISLFRARPYGYRVSRLRPDLKGCRSVSVSSKASGWKGKRMNQGLKLKRFPLGTFSHGGVAHVGIHSLAPSCTCVRQSTFRAAIMWSAYPGQIFSPSRFSFPISYPAGELLFTRNHGRNTQLF